MWGHCSLPLSNMPMEVERQTNVGQHCEVLKNVRDWRKGRKAEKLQMQFVHA